MIALYNTPNVAVVPLIQLWFGFDTEAKVVIVFLSAVFPIIINTYAGVRDVSQATVDVARAFGANDRQILTKVHRAERGAVHHGRHAPGGRARRRRRGRGRVLHGRSTASAA